MPAHPARPASGRRLEDYAVGATYQLGSIPVDEAEILAFAERYDPQAFHTDLEAAAKGTQLWLVDRPSGGLDAHSIRAALEILTQVGEDPAVTMVLVGGDWMAPLGGQLQIEVDRVCTGRPA